MVNRLFLFMLLVCHICSGQNSKDSLRAKLYADFLVGINNKTPSLEDFYDVEKNTHFDYSKNATMFLQDILDNHAKVLLPNQVLFIDSTGLKLNSKQELYFQNNTKIKLLASESTNYNVLEVHEVEDVVIYNPRIEGDCIKKCSKKGEWGMGIAIRSSENVTIKNAEVYYCHGDGIYVGALVKKINGKTITKESKNIFLENAYVFGNYRNGVSLVSVDKFVATSIFSGENGQVFPKAGLDIEPLNRVTNVSIDNLVTFSNGLKGIDFFLNNISKTNSNNNIKIDIKNHTDFYSPIAIRIAAYKNPSQNKRFNINGDINIINSQWWNNGYSALVVDKGQDFSPNFIFHNVKYYKNDKVYLSKDLRIEPQVLKGKSKKITIN